MLASALELRRLTLDEALSDDYIAAPAQDFDPALAQARLEHWRKYAADGDSDLFDQRLARDGLTREAALSRLGGVDRRPGVSEPPWVEDCREALQALTMGGGEGAAGADFPFEPLLKPLIADSVRRLAQATCWNEAFISDAARATATRQLWQRLIDLCGLPLFGCFLQWKSARAPESFDDFVTHTRSAGFAALFDSYPMLLRQIALVRTQWIGAYTEVFQRFERDRALLPSLFPQLPPDFVLSDIQYGLSDPHSGGRSVLVLTLGDGHRVVYKPKDLTTDQIVASLVIKLSALGFDMELRTPAVLVRDGYGWVEFVQRGDCASVEEVSAYYRTAGAWLGLFYLMSASDMHMENLIGCGSHPVPVDFETIYQGLSTEPKGVSEDAKALWLVSSYLEESVLTVGLLPGYVRGESDTLISVGGLEPSTVQTKRIVWRYVNTLAMRAEIAEETATVSSNLPALHGEAVPMSEHRPAFLAGLAYALSFAVHYKDELLDFVQQTAVNTLFCRRVVRPTRFYYMLLRRMGDYRRMSDSIAWSAQSEFIARLYDWESDMELQPWKLFRAERKALAELTIPAFHVAASRTVIGEGGREITNLHMKSGRQISLDRISSLSEEAIADQVNIAATSLGLPAELRASAATTSADLPDAVFQHLRERAFRSTTSAAWLGLEYIDHSGATQLIPVGYDLYNGTCGLAVFFAAAARVRRWPEAESMARAATARLESVLRSSGRKRLVRALGIGAGVGVGSLVYGLTVVSDLLEDASMLDAAIAAAHLLDDEQLAADTRFDTVSGLAGAGLALLKLHSATGEGAFLARAVACGDRLLATTPADGQLWFSPAFSGPLTGIAHGVAGFSLFFSRLYGVTGDSRYEDAARRCIAFENAYYDEAVGNWRDLRPDPRSGGAWWPMQWCYGAAGIGLARLASAASCESLAAIAMGDVERALNATLKRKSHSNDTLCCGVAGHVDFLLAAGHDLGRTDLKEAATQRMEAVARRWAEHGDVRWDQGSRQFNLGLFRGLAGVGYASLRLEDPTLPCVLSWS